MAVNLSIIYYSSTGTTYTLARAIEEGAHEAGADIRFRKVHELAPDEAIRSNRGWVEHRHMTQNIEEATLDDLEWADAMIFGTPTRYGLPTAQLKQFIDQTGPLWTHGKLVNKVASSFCTTSTPHGGQETTITALNNIFYHWGCIIVGPGYADPVMFRSGNPYGASFTSDNARLSPDETARAAARFQGRRVVEVAQQFQAGIAAVQH